MEQEPNTSSQPSQQDSSNSTEQNEYLRWREEQRRKEAEEKAREEEEERKRRERAQQLQGNASIGVSQSNYTSSTSATPISTYKSPSLSFNGPSNYKPPTSFVPTSTGSSTGRSFANTGSGNWKEQREQKEREERLRKEEEERRRKEKAQQILMDSGVSNRPLSASLSWKDQQMLKEQQERARLEEEERRKQERAREIVLQGKGELEDYERRKQEEEERRRTELQELEQQKYEATKAQVPCKGCNKLIDLNDAEYVKGQVYCSLCAPRAAIGATGTCAACGRTLGFSIAKAQNKKYHPECLTCYGCGTNLQSFRVAFDKLWCVNCRPFKPQ